MGGVAGLVFAGGGGAVVVAVINALFAYASRKADSAKSLVEGSVAFTQQLAADNLQLRNRNDVLEEVDNLFDAASRHIEACHYEIGLANRPIPRMSERLRKAVDDRL